MGTDRRPSNSGGRRNGGKSNFKKTNSSGRSNSSRPSFGDGKRDSNREGFKPRFSREDSKSSDNRSSERGGSRRDTNKPSSRPFDGPRTGEGSKSGDFKGSFKRDERSGYRKAEEPKRRFNKRAAQARDGASDETRLNKYISNAGISSRREADNLIKTGVVTVNGEAVVEMGYKVKKGDIVRFNGETIRSEQKVYYILNKPKGFITTTDDPKARKTVMELMKGTGKERIYPVGRLDRKTTGVLMFTNDGDMAKKLTHPSHGARKIYEVSLDKNLSGGDFAKILDGLTLEDGPVKVDEMAYIEGKSKNNIGLVISSGRNRIVRRIFESLDYEVTKLDRVLFAGLTKKTLPRGHYRKLTEKEVEMLMQVQ